MKKIKTINRVRVYDLDGCLVDSRHRYRTKKTDTGECIDLEHWEQNRHKAKNDKLLPLYKKYREDLKRNDTLVIIATARKMGKHEHNFIDKKMEKPDHLIHRTSDAQSTRELKTAGIKDVLKSRGIDRANIKIYEDNAENLKHLCNELKCKGIYIPSKQGH